MTHFSFSKVSNGLWTPLVKNIAKCCLFQGQIHAPICMKICNVNCWLGNSTQRPPSASFVRPFFQHVQQIFTLPCTTTAWTLVDGGVFRFKQDKPDLKYPTWLKAGLILQAGKFTEVIQPIYPLHKFCALGWLCSIRGHKTQLRQKSPLQKMCVCVCMAARMWGEIKSTKKVGLRCINNVWERENSINPAKLSFRKKLIMFYSGWGAVKKFTLFFFVCKFIGSKYKFFLLYSIYKVVESDLVLFC